MIILTSNGLSSETLLAQMRERGNTNGKAAIVTTASVGFKEKDWNLPRLMNEPEKLDYSVVCFDIEFENPAQLLEFDIVEIIGGNPFYLLNQMRLTNSKEIFAEIAKTNVLIGVSAGSVVLQKTIELIMVYTPEMNDDVKLTDFSGLGLTDIEILPHCNKFLTRYDKFEERAKEYEQEHKRTLTRLNDGEAIFIE
jgi:dipeptidase E